MYCMDDRLVYVLDPLLRKAKLHQISYKSKQLIDFALPTIFMIFASIWLIQSVYTLVASQDLFSAMYLWLVNIPMHATTALNLTVLYLVNYIFFRTFLPGHFRVMRAILFTTIGVFFYDLIWSILCITINGYGSFTIPLVSFAIVLVYILIINRNKHTKLLNLNWKRLVPTIIIFLITVTAFVLSGFFQQFALYEQGFTTDPHSWEWLVNKTVTLWMWMIIALR